MTDIRIQQDNETEKQSGYLNMELLRFTTAGSVDDGKSTLIGRLLYDSKAIFEDQMDAIELSSKRRGEENVNLALLTDGLRDEREQGITIDVAYRYFATPKRKFIIADTPGHIQYTRNMVTGASTANVALILIDARTGVIEQTLRHSYIAGLLRIPHIVVCINKMDLVNFDEQVFETIKTNYLSFASKFAGADIHFVPMCALNGDNVVDKSTNMDWYKGDSLLHLLENINISNDIDLNEARFPVQTVIRPQSNDFHDYRGYAGRIASGTFKVGDSIKVLPSGTTSKIKAIHLYKEDLQEATAPQSVSIELEDDVDVSRGNWIVPTSQSPFLKQEITAKICWFNENPLKLQGKYLLRQTSNEVKCIVQEVEYKIDINTLNDNFEDKQIKMNDIASVKIKTAKPLVHDSYLNNRISGSFVLIEEGTNNTVAGGMIV